jgi:hypothetical protein
MWIEKYAEMAGGREGGSKPFGSDTSAVSYGTFLPLVKTTKDVTPPAAATQKEVFDAIKTL